MQQLLQHRAWVRRPARGAEGYTETEVTDVRAGHPINPMRIEVKLAKK